MAQRTRPTGSDKTVNTNAGKPKGLFFVGIGTKWFSDESGEYRCDPATGWAVEKK